jgi:hypothetical protein
MDYSDQIAYFRAQMKAINLRDGNHAVEMLKTRDAETEYIPKYLDLCESVIESTRGDLTARISRKRTEFARSHDMTLFLEDEFKSKFGGLQKHYSHHLAKVRKATLQINERKWSDFRSYRPFLRRRERGDIKSQGHSEDEYSHYEPSEPSSSKLSSRRCGSSMKNFTDEYESEYGSDTDSEDDVGEPETRRKQLESLIAENSQMFGPSYTKSEPRSFQSGIKDKFQRIEDVISAQREEFATTLQGWNNTLADKADMTHTWKMGILAKGNRWMDATLSGLENMYVGIIETILADISLIDAQTVAREMHLRAECVPLFERADLNSKALPHRKHIMSGGFAAQATPACPLPEIASVHAPDAASVINRNRTISAESFASMESSHSLVSASSLFPDVKDEPRQSAAIWNASYRASSMKANEPIFTHGDISDRRHSMESKIKSQLAMLCLMDRNNSNSSRGTDPRYTTQASRIVSSTVSTDSKSSKVGQWMARSTALMGLTNEEAIEEMLFVLVGSRREKPQRPPPIESPSSLMTNPESDSIYLPEPPDEKPGVRFDVGNDDGDDDETPPAYIHDDYDDDDDNVGTPGYIDSDDESERHHLKEKFHQKGPSYQRANLNPF